jgi:hypothetical protein
MGGKSNKNMSLEEEEAILNRSQAEEAGDVEKFEADLKAGRLSFEPITDPESLEFIAKVKEGIEKKRGRPGRPARTTPVEGIYMKWPAPLLEDIRKEADELSLPYQSFIRMAVTEYIRRRRTEKRRATAAGDEP